MTVLEVIQRSTEFLGNKGIESPRLQVELLLAHTLKMPRLKLYLNFERALAQEELDILRAQIKRRANREPLQHIIGSTSFCGLDIKVTPDVLIPRPETEILAEKGWTFLADRHVGGKLSTFLDFGTGSGCLSIAIAKNCPTASGLALDISESALAVARENALHHHLQEKIEFIQSDGLGGLSSGRKFSLIVSNPPYIPAAEISTLAPEVRDYDPPLALDGGSDGLRFYHLLSVEASGLLEPGGKLMAEYGDNQETAIEQIFSQSAWKVESLIKDYTGRYRFIIASRSGD